MRIRLFSVILAAIGSGVAGCSGSDSGGAPSGVGGTGSSVNGVGGSATGGISPTGGASSTGGIANTGGSRSTGGAPASTGGTKASGGSASIGGSKATGGIVGTGGAPATGGKAATGGSLSTGGGLPTGGSKATGGTFATGGSKNTGGIVSTGGAAATGGTSSGGASSYNPCPTNGDPCKILPLGDSITWGIGYDGAYRVELFTKAVVAQQKITFTGSLSNGPTTVSGTTFPQRNEGHSGWTIAQDTALVPSPAMDTANGGIPHIVLVHIGTNDLASSTAQAMATRLGTLVDKVVSAAPNALVVVAKIVPISITTSNNTANAFNNLIPSVVQTRVDAGKHVVSADMNTGFTTSMLGDGIHPTQAGYNLMGDRWYAVIGTYLPK